MNRHPKSCTTLLALALLAGCSRQAPAPAAEAAAEPAPAPVAAPAAEPTPPPEERMVVSAGVAKAGTVNAPDSGLVVVPYAELGQHVGSHVELTTTMGSVRHGTVVSTNTFETQLKLDAADGGFQLAVPAETVAQVRLEPTAAEQPATANAQAH
jgi:hypothetical protein